MSKFTLTGNIPASHQVSSFMNATLTTVGRLAVSIAVTPPAHWPHLTEHDIIGALERDFRELVRIGYDVDIQIGPDDDDG